MNPNYKPKVGDIVVCSGYIHRVDRRNSLEVGDKAKIVNVWPSPPEDARIIDVDPLKGGHRIGSIVISDKLPLEPSNDRESTSAQS